MLISHGRCYRRCLALSSRTLTRCTRATASRTLTHPFSATAFPTDSIRFSGRWSLASSRMAEPVDWSSTADEWANTSSSSTGVPTPVPWISSVPNGLVAYGSVCFIGVVVFTALLVAYYARPKLPPVVGALTFLAWSDRQTGGRQRDRRGFEGRSDDSAAARNGGGRVKQTVMRGRWRDSLVDCTAQWQSLCDPLNPSICQCSLSLCAPGCARS